MPRVQWKPSCQLTRLSKSLATFSVQEKIAHQTVQTFSLLQQDQNVPNGLLLGG